jgi:hypothetical protein
METKKYKRLPYGNLDFRSIVLDNYAYVDKTRYIELLERENNSNGFSFIITNFFICVTKTIR